MIESPPADYNLALVELARQANADLEAAVQSGSNQAFNLGCSLALLPGLVIVVLVFLFSRGNWAMAFIVAVLATVAALVFALFAGNTAKRNTVRRTYERDVNPLIIRTLKELEVDRSVFDRLALQTLPENALLRVYLQPGPSTAEPGLSG